MAKNKIEFIEEDALAPLSALVALDLHQNAMHGTLTSIPNSQKLDQILLSYNFLTSIDNLQRSPHLTVLDLHNNKLDELPDSVLHLYHLKTLTISNNNLSDLNPKLSLLDSLMRLSLEGNPLRSIKPSMRNKGAVEIKKFLKMRLGDEEILKEERQQAKALGVPGASMMKEVDHWEVLLREFVVGNHQLDLKNKELKFISPLLW